MKGPGKVDAEQRQDCRTFSYALLIFQSCKRSETMSCLLHVCKSHYSLKGCTC